MEIYNGTYCVYVHTNKVNGKMYVGQTCRKPEKRWGGNGNGYKDHPLFWRAICKYGWNNFDHDIVASHLTKNEVDNFERLLIKEFNTKNSDFGYNLTDGGEGTSGRILSEKTKRKMSEAQRGEKHPNYGKHLSEEHRQKISESEKGKIVSKETKRKMSEAHKGEKGSMYGKRGVLCPNFGRPCSDETKAKISKANKGKFVGEKNPSYGKHPSEESRQKMSKSHIGLFTGAKHPYAKSVLQFTKDGVFIQKWDCIKQVVDILHINYSSISLCCRGKYKSAGGYVWKYADDSLTQHND